MYPISPESHRPTNHFYILILCLAIMLALVVGILRGISSRLNSVPPVQLASSSAAARSSVTPLAIPTATAATNSAAPTPLVGLANGGAVTPAELNSAPGTYRSRQVSVVGTIFYTGGMGNGKTWIQIVDSNNSYVDGQLTGPLPAGIGKGSKVRLTGIGAGLTTITASNGRQYDQAFVDPVQKVELAS
ncbi:MAG: hypothetical protein ACYDAG_11400 [Chloroflexota bacterium]